MNQVLTWQYWRNQPYQRTVLLIVIFIIAFSKAIQEAYNQDIHGDIYIFWSAGVNFLEGNALYSRIGGAEEFLYPPFAPMTFQLLALMPFPIAVGVFTFFNFIAWLAILRLSYLIIQHYYPTADLSSALLVGFVATIRYFWHNICWVNINEVVALLSLGGIYLHLKGRQATGLLLLTMATWMKVMPALLILLFVIRKPIPTLAWVGLFSGIIFGVILAERGASQGYQDYVDFWQITLLPFLKAGKVYTDTISFSIPSMLAKLLTSVGNKYNDHAYNIADWPLQTVRWISLGAQITVVSLTFWRAWVSRQQQLVPLSILVLVYLTMLLVAGVTWEGHFVIMALLIPAVYQILTNSNQMQLRRWVVYVAIFVGLLIPDTVGSMLYDYAQGFSLISYLTLFLYIISLQENWRVSHAQLTRQSTLQRF